MTGKGDSEERPTLLMVGSGDPMDAALKVALDRHGLFVETVPLADVKRSVHLIAPDLILLVGDASAHGGMTTLTLLGEDAATAAIPVAVLAPDSRLESRAGAFRHGAMAVVPRSASADAVARRVAELSRELSEHFEERTGEIGEASFQELLEVVKRERRSGILSVHAAGHKGGPIRVVLGAGRPVAEAVGEFSARVSPHVKGDNPMYYQFHMSAGGTVQLMDTGTSEGDAAVFKLLRVLLVDDDPDRADALAKALRAAGALVFVTDNAGRGLTRSIGLDPQVAIVDAVGLEGLGFEVVRSIRRDRRLRWASILVAPWDEIWPGGEGEPELAQLATRIEPMLAPERDLKRRAEAGEPFDMRLESMGPSRLLRILTQTGSTLHVSIRNPKAVVDLDVAENLVVSAVAKTKTGAELEGARALATLLAFGSGRVHIEHRSNPTLMNVMSPVDEALAAASQEPAGIPPSIPPAKRPAARAGGPPPSGPGDAKKDKPVPKVPSPGAKPALPPRVFPSKSSAAAVAVKPKPELPKPELPEPDLPKPDLPKPDLPKPKPELPKPELPEPELPKPDLAGAGMPKPYRPRTRRPTPGRAETRRPIPGEGRRDHTIPFPPRPPKETRPNEPSGDVALSQDAITTEPEMPAAVASPAHRPGRGAQPDSLPRGEGAPPPPVRTARAATELSSKLRAERDEMPTVIPPPGSTADDSEELATAIDLPEDEAPRESDVPGVPDEGGHDDDAVTAELRIGDLVNDESLDTVERPLLSADELYPPLDASIDEESTRVRDLRQLAKASEAMLEAKTKEVPLYAERSHISESEIPAHEPTPPATSPTPRRRSGTLMMGGADPSDLGELPPVLVEPELLDPPLEVEPAVPIGAHASAPTPSSSFPPAKPRPPSTDALPAGMPPPIASAPRRGEETVVVPRSTAKPRRGRFVVKLMVALAGLVLVAVLGLIGYRYSGQHVEPLDRVLTQLGVPPLTEGSAPLADGPTADGHDTEGNDTDVADNEGSDTGGSDTERDDSDGSDTERDDSDGSDTERDDSDGSDTERGDSEGDDADGTDAEGDTETDDTEVDDTEVDDTEVDDTEADDTEADDTEVDDTEADDTEAGDTEADDTEAGDDGDLGNEELAGMSADELASHARRAGNSDLAVNLYRRALIVEPDNHRVMVDLGRLLTQRGQVSEAVELLRTAVRRRRRRASYRVYLGDALMAAGDTAGARAEYQEALELEPDNARARRALGQ